MDPSYPLYQVFAFAGFFLVLIPLPWHLQACNAGTCLYMLWTSLSCLNFFVNSIIWHGNAFNPAPVCINRRLYKIATSICVNASDMERRRAVYEDLAIGIGIPVIQMTLPHRFDIFEDIGCFPATFNVWLAYPLSATWPIIIGLVSAIYCVLTLREFHKRSLEFGELLASTSSRLLNINRYFRLMALASTELLCTTPFATYSIYLNLTTQPLSPYQSWADVHYNYSQVDQYPAILWQLSRQTVIAMELNRWMVVACAFIFFVFFGFADETRKRYRALFLFVMKWFGLKSRTTPGVVPPQFERKGPVLPVHTGKVTTAGSFASLSPTSTMAEPYEKKPSSPSRHAQEQINRIISAFYCDHNIDEDLVLPVFIEEPPVISNLDAGTRHEIVERNPELRPTSPSTSMLSLTPIADKFMLHRNSSRNAT
ncbi:pheromone A receptor-domain-containing protein [Phellopilus nigrolimitatus]|nr:pheromone A receptor-domain-containing protein [Phellopilus nigrolimitatus]